jgi:hypothetical protein
MVCAGVLCGRREGDGDELATRTAQSQQSDSKALRRAALNVDLAGHAVHPKPALRLLDGYLQSLTSLEEPPSPELAPIIRVHLLDLVAAALGPTAEAADIVAKRGVKAARVRAILGEIARRLSDPDFDLDRIARTLGLSPVPHLLHGGDREREFRWTDDSGQVETASAKITVE